MYISRGIVAIDEAGNVLRTIVERNAALQNRVLIQSFAVLEEGKQTMLEKTFLDDISRQNFTKYAKAVAAMNGMMFDHVPAPPKGEVRDGFLCSVIRVINPKKLFQIIIHLREQIL